MCSFPCWITKLIRCAFQTEFRISTSFLPLDTGNTTKVCQNLYYLETVYVLKLGDNICWLLGKLLVEDLQWKQRFCPVTRFLNFILYCFNISDRFDREKENKDRLMCSYLWNLGFHKFGHLWTGIRTHNECKILKLDI